MKLYYDYKLRSVLLALVGFLMVEGGQKTYGADFIFGTSTNLGSIVNSSANDRELNISMDGLTLYFTSNRPGGYGGYDLWVTHRKTLQHEWDPPENLGPPINSQYDEVGPSISPDGLELYFGEYYSDSSSKRSEGYGSGDIWVAKRAIDEEPWEEPVNLGPDINGPQYDGMPCISYDGLSLYFASNSHGSNNYDLWMAKRQMEGDSWGVPVQLGTNVNSSGVDFMPSISSDGLALFFTRRELPDDGDIWMARKETPFDPFETPIKLPQPINAVSAVDRAPCITADGSTLFFYSNRSGGLGGYDLWQASINTFIDINGDGIINASDMCIVVDHWGTNEHLCDIGPMPWGDGIVDIQDLIVLSEHLFEEINDSSLVAHWALDETEGFVARDNVGENNAYTIGDPLWQSIGGMVDGALQLDGIDDYVITGAAPNPADGPFCVFVWIKGGVPGQVVISQTGGGVNWLLADPTEGNLMTELEAYSESSGSMLSQTNITDGNWHHIGLVWDGSHRILYDDDIMVAKEKQDGLVGLDSGLYIGTGSTMQSGTYWAGLIDDVRIYNRQIIP